jgi:hypothetical protein
MPFLSLILVVAAFNMIGALTMLVLEKKEDIGVLHAIGASRGFIKKSSDGRLAVSPYRRRCWHAAGPVDCTGPNEISPDTTAG